jgi:hypothetical protein
VQSHINQYKDKPQRPTDCNKYISLNKGIKIHADSHLPSQIKRNTVKNEFSRVQYLSSNVLFKADASTKLCKIFQRNGYNEKQQQKFILEKNRNVTSDSNSTTQHIFSLPYISEEFTAKIRRVFHRNGLVPTIRHRPSLQLKHLLKKCKYPQKCEKTSCPLKSDLCFKYNIVYRMICNYCGEAYIGSTIRHFHERAIEHSRAAANPNSYKNYSVANHMVTKHNGQIPNLSFDVVDQCRDELDCLISEARHIATLSPQMNAKCESDMLYI